MKDSSFERQMERKTKNREKLVENRTKQIESEAEKKELDGEKIEIMTQFMLDPTSSATKLLEKRREMYELQEALQRDKDKFIDKEKQFKKTEEELRNRDELFHRSIVEYYKNTYEKQNSEKANHTLKLQNEQALKSQLESEINQLKISNTKLKSNLDDLRNIKSNLEQYEDFLKKVRNMQSDTYSDITDIINKYKSLQATKAELERESREINTRMQKEKEEFRAKKAEYENRINNIINEINNIQEELKSQKEKKKEIENEVALFEKNSNTVSSSLEQILLAIENIYGKCSEKKNWTTQPLEKKDYANDDERVERAKDMLRCINAYLEDYKDIAEKCKKLK